MKTYFVYILSNYTNSTLYIGVTNDITRRTFEHKQKEENGFAEKYNCYKLVYVEEFHDAESAICREKQIKGWRRSKKDNLVNSINPDWKDLFTEK